MLQVLYAWLAAAAFAASLGFFLFTYAVTFGETHAPPSGSAATPLRQPILINIGLFTAFALHHSLFARTRLKALVHRLIPPALERATYTLLSSILFAAVCWWWRPVPGLLYSVPAPWSWIGFAAQLAGIVLTFLGSRSLDVLELAGVRQVLQSGRRTVPLQTDGVYGLVRHPLYFGWALLVFGAPHMTMTRFVFAVVSSTYLAVAIPWEERGLVDTFGDDYARYKRKVRWRMIPGLY